MEEVDSLCGCSAARRCSPRTNPVLAWPASVQQDMKCDRAFVSNSFSSPEITSLLSSMLCITDVSRCMSRNAHLQTAAFSEPAIDVLRACPFACWKHAVALGQAVPSANMSVVASYSLIASSWHPSPQSETIVAANTFSFLFTNEFDDKTVALRHDTCRPSWQRWKVNGSGAYASPTNCAYRIARPYSPAALHVFMADPRMLPWMLASIDVLSFIFVAAPEGDTS